ncbi:NAD-dependent epimerase/dehydratase family protein [Streptomyces sp. MMS21 TC-5]|uniref:NAD-dependent epimerase/dehydratase family protein n=1 Tax=Streptomyces sp. MMS21 TC-5 TaxID=2925833 RepID=UPI001F625539|nr:NAD-dependent epimerase/dehydratase family protein [Streptomyces sp. MMS21 TC-5]MCI4084451.1 NAD-dependent epimerase/dehydratase family protein [Streptomyces sp. MMS21 TC-5]
MIAVTGASGFCGGHVARAAVAAGARVVGLGRRPGPVGEHRFWDATAGDPDLTGVELVVHCAAAVGDPSPARRRRR